MPQDPATSSNPAPAVSGQVNRGDKTGRQFQSAWNTKYPWILYSECQDKVFWEVCQDCANSDLFLFSTKKDDAFIHSGYSNWKNALAKFAKHDISQCHQEAVVNIAKRNSGVN